MFKMFKKIYDNDLIFYASLFILGFGISYFYGITAGMVSSWSIVTIYWLVKLIVWVTRKINKFRLK